MGVVTKVLTKEVRHVDKREERRGLDTEKVSD